MGNKDRIVVYLSSENKNKLELKADKLGLSASAYIRYLINKAIEKEIK